MEYGGVGGRESGAYRMKHVFTTQIRYAIVVVVVPCLASLLQQPVYPCNASFPSHSSPFPPVPLLAGELQLRTSSRSFRLCL